MFVFIFLIFAFQMFFHVINQRYGIVWIANTITEVNDVNNYVAELYNVPNFAKEIDTRRYKRCCGCGQSLQNNCVPTALKE